jgi:hypothetical protein
MLFAYGDLAGDREMAVHIDHTEVHQTLKDSASFFVSLGLDSAGDGCAESLYYLASRS